MQGRSELGREELGDLMARCATGDESAWSPLLAHVRRVTLDLCRWRYHLGREDAEDLAQVAQIRVAERLSQLRDPAAFPAWLRRLIHCAAIDSIRQQKPCASLDELVSPMGASFREPAAGDVYGQILLRADLDQALAQLPDRYRIPIRMHLLDGLPQEEVGQILGRPRSTVASQIERGLRRMHRTLAAAL